MLLIVVAGITLAALQQGDENGELDPSSYDPRGSRALAALLSHDGIQVQPVGSLTTLRERAGPDTTLLVTVPDRLTGEQQEALGSTAAEADARLVLVAPGSSSLTGLAPGTEARPPAEPSTVAPACAFPAAQRAGDADVRGLRYSTDARPAPNAATPPTGCLPCSASRPGAGHGRHPGVARDRPYGLLGHPAQRPARRTRQRLPRASTPRLPPAPALVPPLLVRRVRRARGTPQLPRTDPRRLALGHPATLFRRGPGRDLARPPPGPRRQPGPARRRTGLGDDRGPGPPVPPADARDQAAALLRRASRARLAELTGVATADADAPDVLLPALASLLENRSPDQDPASLLFGPAPTDDAGLVRLADQLDTLEREVRTS